MLLKLVRNRVDYSRCAPRAADDDHLGIGQSHHRCEDAADRLGEGAERAAGPSGLTVN